MSVSLYLSRVGARTAGLIVAKLSRLYLSRVVEGGGVKGAFWGRFEANVKV